MTAQLLAARDRPLTRAQITLTLIRAALALLACAALMAGAVLAPAPPVVVPLIVLFCIGYPMIAAFDLPAAVGALAASGQGADEVEVAQLRRHLARLPEAPHPLGL